MVYVYENLSSYSDALYESHLSSLPKWRREYALKYKKSEDRKRSVLAFVLLREAVKREFGKGLILLNMMISSPTDTVRRAFI